MCHLVFMIKIGLNGNFEVILYHSSIWKLSSHVLKSEIFLSVYYLSNYPF